MEILEKILFLISIGFLHYRRADAAYPGDKIFVTMRDGCIYDENFDMTKHAPQWLERSHINERPPPLMQFYMRTKDIQYKAQFNQAPEPLTHNPLYHIPTRVIIHDHLLFWSEHYFIESTFEAYNPEHRESWFSTPTSTKPAKGYMYLTVPEGHKYRAPLPKPTYGKDKKKVRDFPPEISSPQSPQTSPPHPHHGASSSGVASTS